MREVKASKSKQNKCIMGLWDWWKKHLK